MYDVTRVASNSVSYMKSLRFKKIKQILTNTQTNKYITNWENENASTSLFCINTF